jgi:hypothetical protein
MPSSQSGNVMAQPWRGSAVRAALQLQPVIAEHTQSVDRFIPLHEMSPLLPGVQAENLPASTETAWIARSSQFPGQQLAWGNRENVQGKAIFPSNASDQATSGYQPVQPHSLALEHSAETSKGVDIDEIVEKVLRKLMRRLAVEGERRGRQQ